MGNNLEGIERLLKTLLKGLKEIYEAELKTPLGKGNLTVIILTGLAGLRRPELYSRITFCGLLGIAILSLFMVFAAEGYMRR